MDNTKIASALKSMASELKAKKENVSGSGGSKVLKSNEPATASAAGKVQGDIGKYLELSKGLSKAKLKQPSDGDDGGPPKTLLPNMKGIAVDVGASNRSSADHGNTSTGSTRRSTGSNGTATTTTTTTSSRPSNTNAPTVHTKSTSSQAISLIDESDVAGVVAGKVSLPSSSLASSSSSSATLMKPSLSRTSSTSSLKLPLGDSAITSSNNSSNSRLLTKAKPKHHLFTQQRQGPSNPTSNVNPPLKARELVPASSASGGDGGGGRMEGKVDASSNHGDDERDKSGSGVSDVVDLETAETTEMTTTTTTTTTTTMPTTTTTTTLPVPAVPAPTSLFKLLAAGVVKRTHAETTTSDGPGVVGTATPSATDDKAGVPAKVDARTNGDDDDAPQTKRPKLEVIHSVDGQSKSTRNDHAVAAAAAAAAVAAAGTIGQRTDESRDGLRLLASTANARRHVNGNDMGVSGAIPNRVSDASGKVFMSRLVVAFEAMLETALVALNEVRELETGPIPLSTEAASKSGSGDASHGGVDGGGGDVRNILATLRQNGLKSEADQLDATLRLYALRAIRLRDARKQDAQNVLMFLDTLEKTLNDAQLLDERKSH